MASTPPRPRQPPAPTPAQAPASTPGPAPTSASHGGEKSGEKSGPRRVLYTDATSIVAELRHLKRAHLEAVAQAAIESCSKAKNAALSVLIQKKRRINYKHCVRCHQAFDPKSVDDESKQCQMMEHDAHNGVIEVGDNEEILWPCCKKNQESDEPCWTGPHITSWNKKVNNPYWKDRYYADLWRRRVKGSSCFYCEHHVGGECNVCCTCEGQDSENCKGQENQK